MEHIYFLNFFSQDNSFLIHFETMIRLSIIVLALILDDILILRRKNHGYDSIDSLIVVSISCILGVFVTLPISLTALSCTINLLGSGMMMTVFFKTFTLLVKKYDLSYHIFKERLYRKHNEHYDNIAPFMLVIFFVICNAYLVIHLIRIVYIMETYNIV